MNERRTYIAQALDPIHIGSGGYRLGRVDNAIVREPGTDLPKIPGTGISGATRSYAAICLGPDYVRCAGQGQPRPREGREGHCGETREGGCPICFTFGYSLGEGKSYAGVIDFFDARILLFPVRSIYGPVWVTTVDLLAEHGKATSSPADVETVHTTMPNMAGRQLNLGWLLLTVGQSNPALISDGGAEGTPMGWTYTCNVRQDWDTIPEAIRDRIVVVHPDIFAQMVNSNLEVRTSVAINPETGAAERGALFTYEAIPRGTVLAFDVVKDDYRPGFPAMANGWQGPFDVLRDGLRAIEWLGVGGMGTRGFGRFKVLNLRGENAVPGQGGGTLS